MKKIFLVEDDTDIREMIEFLLVDLNYIVEAFSSAEEFYTGIDSHHPDLILLDIVLPDGDGSDICEEIKAAGETSSIPVVLMSAHIDPRRLRKSCADDFISKPFDIDDFTARISRQIYRDI